MFEFLPFSRIYKTYTNPFLLKKELFSNFKPFLKTLWGFKIYRNLFLKSFITSLRIKIDTVAPTTKPIDIYALISTLTLTYPTLPSEFKGVTNENNIP